MYMCAFLHWHGILILSIYKYVLEAIFVEQWEGRKKDGRTKKQCNIMNKIKARSNKGKFKIMEVN